MQSVREVVEITAPTRINASHIEIESYGCSIVSDGSLVWDCVDVGLVPWHYLSDTIRSYEIIPTRKTFCSFIGRIV